MSDTEGALCIYAIKVRISRPSEIILNLSGPI